MLNTLATPSSAEFNPPRITNVIRSATRSTTLHDTGPPQYCIINRGTEIKMQRGDLLNIYREKRIVTQSWHSIQILLGSMRISSAHKGRSIGMFTPDSEAGSHPILRHLNVMAGDVAIPSLVLDSDVLFDPGASQLMASASAEVQKVADFILYHNPPTLILEGHTDSDGDVAPNQLLSEQRANALRQLLIDNYAQIDPATVQARGYDERRPIAPNDTDANKALNRRLEVVVLWEAQVERAKSGEEQTDLFVSQR